MITKFQNRLTTHLKLNLSIQTLLEQNGNYQQNYLTMLIGGIAGGHGALDYMTPKAYKKEIGEACLEGEHRYASV